MGGSQSTEKPDYMSYMARLSIKDYKNDEKFWTELLTLAPSRHDISYPFPRLTNEIAIKYPQNFLRLVLICVQHINLLKDGISVSTFPEIILDQFSLSLIVFSTCVESLIYNEKLIPLLNRLDIPLAQAYIKARPQLESYIQLSQKKKQEQNVSDPNNEGLTISKNENNSNEQDKTSLNENKQDEPSKNEYNENEQEEQNKNEHSENNSNNFNANNEQTEPKELKPKINPLFESMRLHEGHIVHTMISYLSNCMFKPGLTLENQEKDWNQSTINYKLLNTTRRDIIHSIYFMNSLNFFLPEEMDPKPIFQIDMTEFPFDAFIISTCIVASKYHMNSYQNVTENETSSLLLNCYGLLMRLYNTEPLAISFSRITPSALIQAFILGDIQGAPLLFQPFDPLANESLTFLYMTLFYQPNFSYTISSLGFSNNFIRTLIEALQVTYEQIGICYFHSIIISSILMIVADETACSFLDQPFNESLKCKFQPNSGTYADVLLESLFNITESSSSNLVHAFAAIFQMIAPHIRLLSALSAEKLRNLFTNAIQSENKKLVQFLLEAFAEIVQTKNDSKNMVLVMIISNQSLFENLKQNEKFTIENNSLEIILTFISTINDELKKSNIQNKDINSIKTILDNFDPSKIFTNPVSFMKHPQILNDEIAASWNEWADLPFKKSFEKELNRMTSLKTELKMKEQQIEFMKKKQLEWQQQQIQQQQIQQQQIKQQQEQKQEEAKKQDTNSEKNPDQEDKLEK